MTELEQSRDVIKALARHRNLVADDEESIRFGVPRWCLPATRNVLNRTWSPFSPLRSSIPFPFPFRDLTRKVMPGETRPKDTAARKRESEREKTRLLFSSGMATTSLSFLFTSLSRFFSKETTTRIDPSCEERPGDDVSERKRHGRNRRSTVIVVARLIHAAFAHTQLGIWDPYTHARARVYIYIYTHMCLRARAMISRSSISVSVRRRSRKCWDQGSRKKSSRNTYKHRKILNLIVDEGSTSILFLPFCCSSHETGSALSLFLPLSLSHSIGRSRSFSCETLRGLVSVLLKSIRPPAFVDSQLQIPVREQDRTRTDTRYPQGYLFAYRRESTREERRRRDSLASPRLFALTLGSPPPRGKDRPSRLIDWPTVAERSRPTSHRFNAVKSVASVAKRSDEARPDGSPRAGLPRIYTTHTKGHLSLPLSAEIHPFVGSQQYAARSSTPPSIAIRAINEMMIGRPIEMMAIDREVVPPRSIDRSRVDSRDAHAREFTARLCSWLYDATARFSGWFRLGELSYIDSINVRLILISVQFTLYLYLILVFVN